MRHASSVTALKISIGDDSRATSVATRRNAACSSTMRWRLSSAAGVSVTGSGTVGRKLSARMAGKRVVVADDDVLVREGIASMLGRAGFDVVGEAGDVPSLERAVRDQTPDLVIVDIRMPPTHDQEGLEAARSIRSEFPEIGILVLSAHIEIDTALDLLEGGNSIGYLLKGRVMKADDLVDALERVGEGGSVIDPELVRELVARGHRTDPLDDLSPREREVLSLMAEGRSNNGIAARLFISEGAVEKHVRSILAKLRLPASDDDHRRVLAVLTFLEAG